MKIKVGLVGFGVSGSIFHAPLLASLPQFELVSILTTRPISSPFIPANTRVVDSLGELLQSGIDLVVIAIPTRHHYSVAKQVLLSGKHVVVDKPFTVTTAESSELLEIAQARSLILTVFHNRRWDNGFLTVQRLIAEGTFGAISSFTARFDRFRPQVNPDRWRENGETGSGILYDLGSHLIDQALSLFGPPTTVFARSAKIRPKTINDDFFHIILDYSPMQVHLSSHSLVHCQTPVFEIHSERCSFIKFGLDPQEEQLRAGMLPNSHDFGVESRDSNGTLFVRDSSGTRRQQIESLPGDYSAFYRELAASLADRTSPLSVPGHDAMQVIHIIELALLSISSGQVVPWKRAIC